MTQTKHSRKSKPAAGTKSVSRNPLKDPARAAAPQTAAPCKIESNAKRVNALGLLRGSQHPRSAHKEDPNKKSRTGPDFGMASASKPSNAPTAGKPKAKSDH